MSEEEKVIVVAEISRLPDTKAEKVNWPVRVISFIQKMSDRILNAFWKRGK